MGSDPHAITSILLVKLWTWKQISYKILDIAVCSLVLYVIGSGLIVSLPPAEDPYRYLFRIIFRGGTIGSSILFGISFFIITRKVTEMGIRNRNILSVERIKDYLTISAIGIVMIGIANEASALQQTFGAAAHGLVYYLLLCLV